MSEYKLEADLKPLLTDEFLALLVLAARTYGWCGDYIEVVDFVEWCFDVAEKKRPKTLEPLDGDT